MSNGPIWTGHGGVLSSSVTTGDTTATTISPGSGSYGSYVELWSACPYQTRALYVYTSGTTTNSPLYVRIAVGAAGSEVVVLDGFPMFDASFQEANRTPEIPIALPKGLRVAIALRSDNTNSHYVHVCLIPASHTAPVGYARGYLLGGAPASTIDAGSTAHTLSSYLNHTTSLDDGVRAIHWLVGTNGTFSAGSPNGYIARLECASEEIAVLFARTRSQPQHINRDLLIPGPFPAGATIRSRHQSNNTTASNACRVLRHAVVAYG